MFQLIKKVKVVIEDPKQVIQVPIPISDVKALKVRWMYYQTATEGNKEMQIRIQEINSSGMFIKNDKSNAKYLMALPLDQNSFVTITYTNFLSEMDAVFDRPLETVNELSFEVLINDVLANDVTPSNPIVMELGFYN